MTLMRMVMYLDFATGKFWWLPLESNTSKEPDGA